MRYETIEDAFYFVSSAAPGEHVAVLSRSTGKVYVASDLDGHDGLPADLDLSEDYLDIPHRSDLAPGRDLVLEFLRLRCPEHVGRVCSIFSRPGAHSRYKAFLAEEGLLEEWYLFEMERIRNALLHWCHEMGLRLEGPRQ